MHRLADHSSSVDPESTDLQQKYHEYKQRWEQLKSDISSLRLQLDEIPQRWKQYNIK